MNKRKIKVVKRDAPAKPAPAVEPKQPVDTDRGISNAVKGWITERQKNRDAENTSDDLRFLSFLDPRPTPTH